MFDELKKYTQKGYVYVLENDNSAIKIGITNNPYNRINSIVHSSGVGVKQYYVSESLKNNNSVERVMHNYFKENRTYGEWFIDCSFDEVVSILKDTILKTGINNRNIDIADCEWGYSLDNGSLDNYSIFDLTKILPQLICSIDDDFKKRELINILDEHFYIINGDFSHIRKLMAQNGVKGCIVAILKQHDINEILNDEGSIEFYRSVIGLMKFSEAEKSGIKLRHL